MAASTKSRRETGPRRAYGQEAGELAGYYSIAVALGKEGAAAVHLLHLDMSTRRLVAEALSPRQLAGPGRAEALRAIHDGAVEAAVDGWVQLPLWC